MALHLSAYGGRDDGLFAGAISESLFFPAQPYLNELEWQFNEVVLQLGCGSYSYGTPTDQMACLRGKDMASLQALNNASPFPGRTPDNPLFFWSPCVDGDMIQDLPYILFQTGRFIKMPVMFGTCTDGSSIFPSSLPHLNLRNTRLTVSRRISLRRKPNRFLPSRHSHLLPRQLPQPHHNRHNLHPHPLPPAPPTHHLPPHRNLVPNSQQSLRRLNLHLPNHQPAPPHHHHPLIHLRHPSQDLRLPLQRPRPSQPPRRPRRPAHLRRSRHLRPNEPGRAGEQQLSGQRN